MADTSSTASSLTRLGGNVGAGFLFVLGPAPVMPEDSALEWGFDDLHHPSVLLPAESEGTKAQVTPVKVAFKHVERRPRTQLGERLLALRAQAISKGMDLLSWEEVSEEVRQRRGERLSGQ